MAEGLALVDVGDMDFDAGQRHAGQRVAQRDAGMRQTARVDDDEAGAVGARSVPLGGLEKSANLPKNKALPLVVVCPTGARATRAAATLKKLGFDNARALAGGLAAWREANLPLEKSA